MAEISATSRWAVARNVTVAFLDRQLERENPYVQFKLGWMLLRGGLYPADLQLGFSVSGLAAGSFTCVEDRQVCCQPIELTGEVDNAGALVGVTANRAG